MIGPEPPESAHTAAAQSFSDLKVRAVLDIKGQTGFAVVSDEYVDGGHVQQLVEIFTLNDAGGVGASESDRPVP